MLPFIERVFEASRINEIMNHPAVNSWISDKGAIDMAPALARDEVIILLGEFGGFSVRRLLSGVYEFHTQVLPEGRGRWGFEFFQAGLRWMFTNTDAFELITRVPGTHRAARMAARLAGLRFDFTEDNRFEYRGDTVSSDIYAIRIQEWASAAPGMEELGAWLHEGIETSGAENGVIGGVWPEAHGDSPSHNRYLGVAYLCVLGGQVDKGVAIYNRWSLASHNPRAVLAQVLSREPPVIELLGAELTLSDDGQITVKPKKDVRHA